jgi:hypothetical protein
MAHKRMFSMSIIDTDAFLEMPPTSQLLYFHLSMRADDEGFVGNPKKIIRMCGFSDDDFKILIAKKFILIFESGVVVIKHWLIHNTIRSDRFTPTNYNKEKSLLYIKENKSYSNSGNQLATKRKPSIEKNSKDIEKNSISSDLKVAGVDDIMKIFYKINPTLNWGNKTNRKACEDLIKKFGLEDTKRMAEQVIGVQGKPYTPVATTPYQMKEKLAQFAIYFKTQKNKAPAVFEGKIL